MKKLYVILTLLLALATPSMAGGDAVDSALKQLDRAVANDSIYTRKKLDEIERLKGNLRAATLPVDRYLSCKQVAEVYSHVMSDSALVYYHRCLDIARAEGNAVWAQEAAILQAIVFADRGDNHIAKENIDRLGGIDAVHPTLRHKYAEAVMMVYVRLTDDGKNQLTTSRAREEWDGLAQYFTPRSMCYFLFYTIAHPEYDPAKVARQIETVLAGTRRGTPEEGILRMMLGICYNRMHRQDRAIVEFALSAAADIGCANKNSSALTMLLAELIKRGDTDTRRLLEYTRLNIANINMFNDTGRSIHLVNAQQPILIRYQKSVEARMRAQCAAALLAALLLVMSATLTWRLHRKNKTIAMQSARLASSVQTLESDMSRQLSTASEKEKTIENLVAARGVADGVLARQFALLSGVLDDVRAYKREIANRMASGQMAEARKLAKESVARDRTTALFCENFDRDFLLLHPGFPGMLNSLLRGDAQLHAEKEGTLTPEQRIYALVSLGVDDSRNIADILHYSVQTVYNYRMKVRHAAADPQVKVDDAVRMFYSAAGATAAVQPKSSPKA